jgi:hypothetical protein
MVELLDTWRSFDYDAFAVDLEESDLILDPPTDVNELFACCDVTLIRLLDKRAPLRNLKVRDRPAAPWFDAECLQGQYPKTRESLPTSSYYREQDGVEGPVHRTKSSLSAEVC